MLGPLRKSRQTTTTNIRGGRDLWMEEIPILSDKETGLPPSLFFKNLHSTSSSGVVRTLTPAMVLGPMSLPFQADATGHCLQPRAEEAAKTAGEITEPLGIAAQAPLGPLHSANSSSRRRRPPHLPTASAVQSGCPVEPVLLGRLIETLFWPKPTMLQGSQGAEVVDRTQSSTLVRLAARLRGPRRRRGGGHTRGQSHPRKQ